MTTQDLLDQENLDFTIKIHHVILAILGLVVTALTAFIASRVK